MNWNDFQKQHIQKADIGKFNVDGDMDFDLERHNKIVEDTLKHNDRVARDKHREFDQGIQERAYAATRYIENLKSGKGETNIEKYFGKNYASYLKGQQILNKYKMAWTDGKKKEQGKAAYLSHIKSQGNV